MLSEELGRMLQAAVVHNLRRNCGFPEGRIGCTAQKAKDQGECNRCSDYATGVDYPRFESPRSTTDVSVVHNVETGSLTQPASYSIGNGVHFRR
jgi:hypothetical protein